MNNAGLLPSKTSWKLTVNTVVNAYETDNWKLRIDVDPDFSRFERLHTAIYPSVIYDVFTDVKLNFARTIANIWVTVPDVANLYCKLCLPLIV